MRLEMLGAVGGEVTGSAFAVTSKTGANLLVDCGLFQGKKDDARNKSLNSHDPNQFDVVAITHAHLDHLGKLPFLWESKTKIYMTRPSRALAGIILPDADRISQGNLFPKGSVDAVLKKIIPVNYNSPISIDGITATFENGAGHILGSSIIKFQEENGDLVVFSGDLGNPASRTVKPGTPIKEANVIIMETTYGDRNHPEEDPVEIIKDAIRKIKKTNGTLLIPTFAIDRVQAILSILKELSENGKLGIPVYLDSPMAIETTRTYKDYPELLNDKLGKENLFNFPGLKNTYSYRESLGIKDGGPKIIIAGSGMMSGGRAPRHAENYLVDKRNIILFVGYPAEGTVSRAIVEGEKEVKVNEKSTIYVNGTVLHTSGLSAHADQKQLLNWLRTIYYGGRRLREVILVHGTDQSRKAFAELIRAEFGEAISVLLPKENDKIELHQNN